MCISISLKNVLSSGRKYTKTLEKCFRHLIITGLLNDSFIIFYIFYVKNIRYHYFGGITRILVRYENSKRFMELVVTQIF